MRFWLKKNAAGIESAADEVALMLSRGTVRLVDRDAPSGPSFAQAFSARGEVGEGTKVPVPRAMGSVWLLEVIGRL